MIDDLNCNTVTTNEKKEQFSDKIILDNVTFGLQNLPLLHGVTTKIPKGLTCVIGRVASGKSLFLQAILGELDILSGHHTKNRRNRIAFVSQIPFIEDSLSIRENIHSVFPFEKSWYNQVLKSCDLLEDLARIGDQRLAKGLSGKIRCP